MNHYRLKRRVSGDVSDPKYDLGQPVKAAGNSGVIVGLYYDLSSSQWVYLVTMTTGGDEIYDIAEPSIHVNNREFLAADYVFVFPGKMLEDKDVQGYAFECPVIEEDGRYELKGVRILPSQKEEFDRFSASYWYNRIYNFLDEEKIVRFLTSQGCITREQSLAWRREHGETTQPEQPEEEEDNGLDVNDLVEGAMNAFEDTGGDPEEDPARTRPDETTGQNETQNNETENNEIEDVLGVEDLGMGEDHLEQPTQDTGHEHQIRRTSEDRRRKEAEEEIRELIPGFDQLPDDVRENMINQYQLDPDRFEEIFSRSIEDGEENEEATDSPSERERHIEPVASFTHAASRKELVSIENGSSVVISTGRPEASREQYEEWESVSVTKYPSGNDEIIALYLPEQGRILDFKNWNEQLGCFEGPDHVTYVRLMDE